MEFLAGRHRPVPHPRTDSDSSSGVKIRVQQWLTGVWADMRRKSPVAVQQWVDSLPCPANNQMNTTVTSDTSSMMNEKKTNLVECVTTSSNVPMDTQSLPEKNDINDGVHCEILENNIPLGIRIPRRNMIRELSMASDSPRQTRMLLRDSSFQSDDAVSHCSSVESLLESRRADPEAVLLGLGFGPVHSQEYLSRIPQRFLRPSQLRGVDTDSFLREQQRSMEIHDSGVWGYRGLTDSNFETATCLSTPIHSPVDVSSM